MPRRRRVDRRRVEDPLTLMSELAAANLSGCAAFPEGRTVDGLYEAWSRMRGPARSECWGWLAFEAGAERPCDELEVADPFEDGRGGRVGCGTGDRAGRCLFRGPVEVGGGSVA